MIERQSSESIEFYKKRITFLVNYILPSIEKDDLTNVETFSSTFGDLNEEDKDLLLHRLIISIRDIYQIGIDVLKNSSCISAEKNLNEIFYSLKKEIDELRERKSIENKMMALLEKKLSFLEVEMENIIDYEDYKNLGISRDISTSDYKNIIEANNKVKLTLDEIIKKIDKVKELSDLIKLSREIIKN